MYQWKMINSNNLTYVCVLKIEVPLYGFLAYYLFLKTY
jgi:hypothetical protein